MNTRKKIPKEVEKKIIEDIPPILHLTGEVIQQIAYPDMVILKYRQKNKCSLAKVKRLYTTLVYFYECIDFFANTYYSLIESEAHLEYYRNYCKKTDINYSNREIWATHFCQFYLDNVILRLCASAEKFAQAVIEYYRLKTIIKRQNKKNISLSVRLGKYLTTHKSNYLISCNIRKLLRNHYWEFIWRYRNDWVHNQRWSTRTFYKPQLEIRNNGIIAGWNSPKMKIDDLLKKTKSATKGYYDLVSIFWTELRKIIV